MSSRTATGVCSQTRGAVLVEHLLVLLPILLLGLCTWQSIELWAGDLIVRRAAAAAARAAVVVLPDDPTFYAQAPVDQFIGARKMEIELAASLVLAASPNFRTKPLVEVTIASEHEPLTATVRALFHCSSGWMSLVCTGSRRLLSATATLPYQGARYHY